jgi:hypothetical protein
VPEQLRCPPVSLFPEHPEREVEEVLLEHTLVREVIPEAERSVSSGHALHEVPPAFLLLQPTLLMDLSGLAR